jgi:hypothetical protein
MYFTMPILCLDISLLLLTEKLTQNGEQIKKTFEILVTFNQERSLGKNVFFFWINPCVITLKYIK